MGFFVCLFGLGFFFLAEFPHADFQKELEFWLTKFCSLHILALYVRSYFLLTEKMPKLLLLVSKFGECKANKSKIFTKHIEHFHTQIYCGILESELWCAMLSNHFHGTSSKT